MKNTTFHESRGYRFLTLWLPLILFLVFLLFPFYWTLVTSLKTDTELHSLTVVYWPQQPTLAAYRYLFQQYNFLHPMRNSLLVAVITMALSLTVSTLAAYSFSRFPFPSGYLTSVLPSFVKRKSLIDLTFRCKRVKSLWKLIRKLLHLVYHLMLIILVILVL